MSLDPRSLPKTPDGYREAWSTLEQVWAATVDRARRLPEPRLHERVDEEWSFVETLRHLVFATDRWVGRNVLGRAEPYHPLGLPPGFRLGELQEGVDLTPFGLDIFAEAALDEVLAVRSERQHDVAGVIQPLTDEGLAATVGPYDTAGAFPHGATFVVRDCLDVVIKEEWLHHGYAARDLTSLESR